MTKPDVFRQMSDEELKQKLEELRKKLYDLNFQRVTGSVQKPHLFKEIRKDIARILTILNERKRNASKR